MKGLLFFKLLLKSRLLNDVIFLYQTLRKKKMFPIAKFKKWYWLERKDSTSASVHGKLPNCWN